MPVYEPEEDSYLLSETLKKYLINLIKKDKIKSNSNLLNKTFNQQKPKLKFHNINNTKSISILKNLEILDLGSGSGIQAETCKELGFNDILTADINQESVKLLKNKGFKSIKTDLFSKINKKQKFNLIIFNPPYLPEDKYDKKPNTTGGKKGYELILKFLKQAKNYLNSNGKIILLFSSLSNPEIIKTKAKQLGYALKLLNQKKLFF